MEIENRKSTFIRDLIVRILLIVLFIFLLMFLFPMPNLTPFYDAVFNNNVQTMKDAAEKWYTTDRMPEEVGDIDRISLQEMLDKKLVLPFVDKDGNSCDSNKSYVSVKKTKDEYVMKVSLTCGSKTDYIIEHIGCYNFCKDGKCTNDVAMVETNEKTGETKVTPTVTPTPTKTPYTPSQPVYAMEYEYARTNMTEKWTIGDWQNNKLTETDDLKLVDTRIQYTGQKKITDGTTLYKHVKYAYKDKWSYDTDWTEEVKSTNDNLKLYAERTLYTGQKKTTETLTKYKHVKYGVNNSWTVIPWSTQKRTTNNSVVLTGTRYTVRKTVKKTTTTGTWSDWEKDTTWRSSKPADSATKQWSSSPYNSKVVVNSTSTSWVVLYNSYRSTSALTTFSGDRWNEFLYSKDEACTLACNGQSTVRVYYYRVHQKKTTQNTSTLYQYKYRTYSTKTSTSTSVDEKVVTDASSYVKDGYTIIKTEYEYKVNQPSQYVADVQWTESITPPAGYTYTGQTATVTVTRYTSLGKWVTNQSKLGEYTYNMVTKKQYKYRYNTPEKYIEDTIWTESINSPEGYTYTGESKSNEKTSYSDLGEWVNSKSELGEYTYNVTTRTQYKYKTRTTSSSTETKWFSSNPGGDWNATGNSRRVLVK